MRAVLTLRQTYLLRCLLPGDVYKTCANIDAARALIGYQPTTGIEEGLRRFVAWYRAYYE